MEMSLKDRAKLGQIFSKIDKSAENLKKIHEEMGASLKAFKEELKRSSENSR